METATQSVILLEHFCQTPGLPDRRARHQRPDVKSGSKPRQACCKGRSFSPWRPLHRESAPTIQAVHPIPHCKSKQLHSVREDDLDIVSTYLR